MDGPLCFCVGANGRPGTGGRIAPKKQEFDHASSILYFAVPDIQAAHASLKAQSVKSEDEPR